MRAVPFVLLNLLGAMAYLHPFIFSSLSSGDLHRNREAPLVFGALGALCLALVVADLTSGRLNSKSLAVIGVMAAMAAVLRTITLPAGANLFWLLVIIGAYVFGPRPGFLIGALAMGLSAVVTGGFGPWLPFQAFGAAWIGVFAGTFGMAAARLPWLRGRREVAALALAGALSAIAYGLVINLWDWPFLATGPDTAYERGLGPAETVRRYWNFYLLTSFGWDLIGSACNVIGISLIGGPLLAALRRFRDRFSWTFEQRPLRKEPPGPL
jgi:energy-coupling factor transport system substrate-specific component